MADNGISRDLKYLVTLQYNPLNLSSFTAIPQDYLENIGPSMVLPQESNSLLGLCQLLGLVANN